MSFSPYFASSRGKKDKKSEHSRDKRDRSISRKGIHKDEDRIKGKTKSMRVTFTWCSLACNYGDYLLIMSHFIFVNSQTPDGDEGKNHDCCSFFFFLIIGRKCLQKREKGRLPKQQRGLGHTWPENDVIASLPIQRQLQDSKRGRCIYGNRLRQVRITSLEKPI